MSKKNKYFDWYSDREEYESKNKAFGWYSDDREEYEKVPDLGIKIDQRGLFSLSSVETSIAPLVQSFQVVARLISGIEATVNFEISYEFEDPALTEETTCKEMIE